MGAARLARLTEFKGTGSSVGNPVELYDFTELTKLMGFQDVWDFDQRHAD